MLLSQRFGTKTTGSKRLRVFEDLSQKELDGETSEHEVTQKFSKEYLNDETLSCASESTDSEEQVFEDLALILGQQA